MPEKLHVKANPGEKCPREGDPRHYITDDPKGVEVVASSYYRRLVSDGSLVMVEQKKTKGGDQ